MVRCESENFLPCAGEIDLVRGQIPLEEDIFRLCQNDLIPLQLTDQLFAGIPEAGDVRNGIEQAFLSLTVCLQTAPAQHPQDTAVLSLQPELQLYIRAPGQLIPKLGPHRFPVLRIHQSDQASAKLRPDLTGGIACQFFKAAVTGQQCKTVIVAAAAHAVRQTDRLRLAVFPGPMLHSAGQNGQGVTLGVNRIDAQQCDLEQLSGRVCLTLKVEAKTLAAQAVVQKRRDILIDQLLHPWLFTGLHHFFHQHPLQILKGADIGKMPQIRIRIIYHMEQPRIHVQFHQKAIDVMDQRIVFSPDALHGVVFLFRPGRGQCRVKVFRFR